MSDVEQVELSVCVFVVPWRRVFVCGQEEVPVNPLRVFVGGLGRDVTEEALKELFSTAGAITEVVIKAHRKGFAFVTFENAAGVAKALALTGTDLGGRPINVKPEERRVRTVVAGGGQGAASGAAPGVGAGARGPRRGRAAGGATAGAGAGAAGAGAGRRRTSGSEDDSSAKPSSDQTVWIGNLPEGACLTVLR